MRFAGPLLLLLVGTGCSVGEKSRQDRLMDEIEAHLTLPKGSLPLAKYARYYTDYGGRIHGAYTTEIERRPADVGCEEMLANGTSKDVPCSAVADLQPGHRRWVQFSDFPAVVAGGCRAIQVMYNPSTRSIEYAGCLTPTY